MALKEVLPAKVGTLPVFLTELLGEKGSLFLLVGSGRLTLAPSGPGQGLHPNWLSLTSPRQVGYGSHVPSMEQTESMAGPLEHGNAHFCPRYPSEQYPEIPGQNPGICSSFPGSCSMQRGTSVHVPSS